MTMYYQSSLSAFDERFSLSLSLSLVCVFVCVCVCVCVCVWSMQFPLHTLYEWWRRVLSLYAYSRCEQHVVEIPPREVL
jgi:hypothetical protein